MQQTKNDYIAVSEAAREYPFSEAALRWLIANAAVNGFDQVIVRIRGRVFLKRSRFDQWFKENQTA